MNSEYLICPDCSRKSEHYELNVCYDYEHATPAEKNSLRQTYRSIWGYKSFLPVADDAQPVTLGEGATPLTRFLTAEHKGYPQIWCKNESQNPTWSHKDRLNSVLATTAKAMPHEKRRFVAQMPYITSPGWIKEAGRAGTGLPVNRGPMRSSIALVMKSFRLSPTASAAACISDLWPFGTNGISELSAQRKAQYEDYRKAKTNMLEWAATKNNMERILRTTDKEKRVLSSLW